MNIAGGHKNNHKQKNKSLTENYKDLKNVKSNTFKQFNAFSVLRNNVWL